MTPEMQRLFKKLTRLKARRETLPKHERTAINAEIKAVADDLARREAIRQGAIERPIEGITEWVETSPEPGEPEVVDLRGGKTIEDYLRERDGDLPPAA